VFSVSNELTSSTRNLHQTKDADWMAAIDETGSIHARRPT
jgi:hypothetical protein